MENWILYNDGTWKFNKNGGMKNYPIQFYDNIKDFAAMIG